MRFKDPFFSRYVLAPTLDSSSRTGCCMFQVSSSTRAPTSSPWSASPILDVRTCVRSNCPCGRPVHVTDGETCPGDLSPRPWYVLLGSPQWEKPRIDPGSRQPLDKLGTWFHGVKSEGIEGGSCIGSHGRNGSMVDRTRLSSKEDGGMHRIRGEGRKVGGGRTIDDKQGTRNRSRRCTARSDMASMAGRQEKSGTEKDTC